MRTQTLIESSHVSDAFINTLINQGLLEVAAMSDWPWLQAKTNLSLADSTRTIDLPADFLRAIVLIDDDEDMAVPFIAPNKFFARLGNDTGNEGPTPDAWTIFDNDIYLTPIPEANDTARLTLYYFKEATALSQDTDVPAFPDAYHWLLVEYCKWKLYEREEYYDQAQAAFTSYMNYVDDMIVFFNNQVAFSPSVYGRGYGMRHRSPFPNVPWWDVF